MAIYLNTKAPFENYSELAREYYFVDKSEIIKSLNSKVSTKSKYVCITRPRRFGKSSVADMLGAYYSKAVDSHNIFDKLKISKDKSYKEHLNKYNVLSISFNQVSHKGNTYDDYIGMIKANLIKDISDKYPQIDPSEYFTINHMLKLCEKNDEIKFSDLESWYNGYLTTKGKKIYNPRSVIKALQNGYCESYWTNTGAMDEVTDYLKYNTLEIREDVIEMVSGEEVDIFIDEEFRAGQREPRTKEEIYSAMIILGFLSYHDGYLRIPNRELMKEFEKALKDESFGEVSRIIENSRKMKV